MSVAVSFPGRAMDVMSGSRADGPARRGRRGRAVARTFGLTPAALLVCGLLLVAGAPPALAASSGDWPQFRNGPTHHGHNAQESLLSAANVAGLSVAWTGASAGSETSSPAVADGVVYIRS